MEPGTVLGTYQIERLLGRGGMGAVFLAHDTTLHRPVALKVVEDSAGGASARARVVREARNAAALNHPNICTIHEVGDSGETAFIAMEFVEGRALADRLDEGALPLEEAVRLGIQAADALAFAHQRGVIHRDFKAANVIVTPEGRLKVVDFGLARRDDGLGTGATTMATVVPAGAAAGTPYAMAPEQIRGAPADARTDIWALGVLLYEMVSGARPFKGATIPELFASILTDRPAALPAAVPAGIQAIVERCLEKVPERRYQRASEVHEALQEIAAGTIAARVAWRYQLRRRRVLLATAALIVCVALLGALNVGGLRDWLAGNAPPAPPIKLAVLPFQNLTGDPEQEYFSDGLTDEMITQLGRLHPQRLSVIARTSSMQYKKRDKSIGEIGRELGVEYVLEGSARREGSRIRISATLIEVTDQTQRWSDTFDRELAGVLTLQNDVARGVAEALALALLPEERTRLAAASPVNPEAYEAYLRGLSYVHRLNPVDLAVALRHFEAALEKDPKYTLAYVGIARVWGTRWQLARSRAEFGEAATVAAETALANALALDDELPEVHLAMASKATWTDWDWAAAEPHFRRALDLNPSHAEARAFYSQYLQVVKRPDEAMAQIEHAIKLDPLNPLIQAFYGLALNTAGRNEEALVQLRDALRAAPDSGPALNGLQGALHNLGKDDESLDLQQARAKERGDVEMDQALSVGRSEGGYLGAMRRAVEVLEARSRVRNVNTMEIARMYVLIGNHERAIDWLERAYDEHSPNLPSAGHRRPFQPLHGHARFQALLRRMNLPN